jgi:hypothetical protein
MPVMGPAFVPRGPGHQAVCPCGPPILGPWSLRAPRFRLRLARQIYTGHGPPMSSAWAEVARRVGGGVSTSTIGS